MQSTLHRSIEARFRNLGRTLASAEVSFAQPAEVALNILLEAGMIEAAAHQPETDEQALRWFVDGFIQSDAHPQIEPPQRTLSVATLADKRRQHAIDAAAQKLADSAFTEVVAKGRHRQRFGLFGPGLRLATYLERNFPPSDDPFAQIAACIQHLFPGQRDINHLLSTAMKAATLLSPARLKVAEECFSHVNVRQNVQKMAAFDAFIDCCTSGRFQSQGTALIGLPVLVAFSTFCSNARASTSSWMNRFRDQSVAMLTALKRCIDELPASKWPDSAQSAGQVYFAMIALIDAELEDAESSFIEFFDGLAADRVAELDLSFLSARHAVGGCVPLEPSLVYVLGNAMFPWFRSTPAKDPIFDLTTLMQADWHWDEGIEIAGAFDETFNLFTRALRRLGFPREASLSTVVHLFLLASEGPLDLCRPQRWRKRIQEALPLDAGAIRLFDLAIAEASGRSGHLGRQLSSLLASTGYRAPIDRDYRSAPGALQIEMRLSGRIGALEWSSISREARDLLVNAEIEFKHIAPALGERTKDYVGIASEYAKAIEAIACSRLRELPAERRSAFGGAGVSLASITIGTVVTILRKEETLRKKGVDLRALGFRPTPDIVDRLERFRELRNRAIHGRFGGAELVSAREAVPDLVKELVAAGFVFRD